MRAWRIVLTLFVLCSLACSREGKPRLVRLQGAGASFPAPLYGRWFKTYNAQHPNVQIDYQSTGSGAGVKNMIDGTVDFAASDAAMSDAEMARVERGVQPLPLTAGSIVLSYHLPSVRALRLTREAYVGIFLGKVERWNDPAIAKANPGVQLPNAPIHVVVRADSSGTSFVFSQHLSEVSAEFAKAPGTNKMPNWPVGTRAKGNEGIAANIETTPGAIGYLEYGYAKTQQLPMAVLENRAGHFVEATLESARTALAGAEFGPKLIAWNADPVEPDAYPIVTYTWLLLYRRYERAEELEALRGFVRYAVGEGQQLAPSLGYVPLPEGVRERVREAIDGVRVASKESP